MVSLLPPPQKLGFRGVGGTCGKPLRKKRKGWSHVLPGGPSCLAPSHTAGPGAEDAGAPERQPPSPPTTQLFEPISSFRPALLVGRTENGLEGASSLLLIYLFDFWGKGDRDVLVTGSCGTRREWKGRTMEIPGQSCHWDSLAEKRSRR